MIGKQLIEFIKNNNLLKKDLFVLLNKKRNSNNEFDCFYEDIFYISGLKEKIFHKVYRNDLESFLHSYGVIDD